MGGGMAVIGVGRYWLLILRVQRVITMQMGEAVSVERR
jgi:hypothetical protein